MESSDITAEMERFRADFHHLIDDATTAELRAGSDGTEWTNEQLLFHMLFGYLLVHNLLPLVKVLASLPRRVSKGFAAILNAGTKPVPCHQLRRLTRRRTHPRPFRHGAPDGPRRRPAPAICDQCQRGRPQTEACTSLQAGTRTSATT